MAIPLRDVTNLLPNLTVTIPCQANPCQPQINRPLDGVNVLPKTKRSNANNDSGCDLMDDSLTDMQWLQRMDANQEIQHMGSIPSELASKHGPYDGVTATKGGNKPKSNKDSCRKKLDYTSKKSDTNKPPLSYASLIALAICSTPQRMMTLSGIYRWIESTFPFYRTPEAKAWKNSIRHNLSIRKNMFMKVYQYPPRRGNGSYWTLLSDGEEELKRAIPLFTTLHPPVIDPESVYNRQTSAQTIKTKGQFVPLLPRTGHTVNTAQPYFAIDSSNSVVGNAVTSTTTLASGVQGVESGEVLGAATEVVVTESGRFDDDDLSDERPKHLADHNYARLLPFKNQSEGTVASIHPEIHILDESFDSLQKYQCSSTPKRRKILSTTRPSAALKSTSVVAESDAMEAQNRDSGKPTFSSSFFALNTPSRDHQQHQNDSLNLLDSSLLTPLTKLTPEIDSIGPISLSPLYANFVTPQRSGSKSSPTVTSSSSESLAPPTSSMTSSLSYSGSGSLSQQPALSSPFTPLKSTTDSGVFSPFRSSDSLLFRFSTPARSTLSPLTDLFPSNTLNTPQHSTDIFSPFKGLDASSGIGTTPIRLGSLQALGLPGLTPPPHTSSKP